VELDFNYFSSFDNKKLKKKFETKFRISVLMNLKYLIIFDLKKTMIAIENLKIKNQKSKT